jgi:membrane protease YdiL (CAAX protease family)
MGVLLLINIGFDSENFTVNNISSSLIPLILLSFLLIPFQAAFEEVIFRGYLMQGFTVLSGVIKYLINDRKKRGIVFDHWGNLLNKVSHDTTITLFPARIFTLLATAILFALMHSLNPEVKEFGFLSIMPQYFIFGLIFGLLTILDNGIESTLGAHAANNIFLCIFVTHKASALQTPALFEQNVYRPGAELAGMIVVGAIFVFLLWKIFKWKNVFAGS